MKCGRNDNIHPKDFDEILKESVDFLLKEENRTALGFCAQIPGIKNDSCATTSIIVYALSFEKNLTFEQKDNLKKLVYNFYNENDGSFGEIEGSDSILWCTAQACLALLNLGVDVDSLMPSIKWLCENQTVSGGWCYNGMANDDIHIIYSLYPAIFLHRISKIKKCDYVDQTLQKLLQFVKKYKDDLTLDRFEVITKYFILNLFSNEIPSFSQRNELIKRICYEKYRNMDLSSTITETKTPRLFYIKIFEQSFYLLLRPFISPDHNISLYYIRQLYDGHMDEGGWDRNINSMKGCCTWSTALAIVTIRIWLNDCKKASLLELSIPSLKLIVSNMRRTGNMNTFVEICPMNGGSCNRRHEIISKKSDKRVFIDIPYDASYLDYRDTVINIIKDNGLEPVIADQTTETTMVLCKVCSYIQTCSFGVADISIAKKSNIHFELGLMFGLNISCAVLLQSGKRVPSDLSGIEYLSYRNTAELKKSLNKWIKDNITQRP